METDLPRLYEKIWSMRGWSMSYRCCNWSHMLTPLMHMPFCHVNVSCTTKFCPLAKQTRLAPTEARDVDGFPKFISLGWPSTGQVLSLVRLQIRGCGHLKSGKPRYFLKFVQYLN